MLGDEPASDDPLDGAVQPGDVLAGKHRVERIIGVGGMGVVVQALHHCSADCEQAD